jgi:hypothetical protein
MDVLSEDEYDQEEDDSRDEEVFHIDGPELPYERCPQTDVSGRKGEVGAILCCVYGEGFFLHVDGNFFVDHPVDPQEVVIRAEGPDCEA